MALQWDKLSPAEFQQLQDLASYSSKKLQDVLLEFCATTAPGSVPKYQPDGQNIIKMRRGSRGPNEKTHSIKDNSIDIDEDDNTDLGFFKTLLPHVSKIEESEKLVFQQTIQQVVLDFAYPTRNQDFIKTYEASSEAQCKKIKNSKRKKENHDTSSDDDDCIVIEANIESRAKGNFKKLPIKQEIKTEPVDVKPATQTNMKPHVPISYISYLPNYYAAPDGQPQYFGNGVSPYPQVPIQYQQSPFSQPLVPSYIQQMQPQYIQQQAPTQLQQQIPAPSQQQIPAQSQQQIPSQSNQPPMVSQQNQGGCESDKDISNNGLMTKQELLAPTDMNTTDGKSNGSKK